MNILGAPHKEPIHSAGIELMPEVAFDLLPSLALHSFAALSADAPPIAIDRFLFRRLALPVAHSAIRFRNVSPHLQCAQPDEDFVAMVPLVRNHFFHSTGVDLVF